MNLSLFRRMRNIFLSTLVEAFELELVESVRSTLKRPVLSSLREHVSRTAPVRLHPCTRAGATLCGCPVCPDTKWPPACVQGCNITTLDPASLQRSPDEMLFILFSSVESC